MITELKNTNEVLKRNVKRNYQNFDKFREDIVERFYEQCKSYDTKEKQYDLEQVFGEFEIIKNMTLTEILELFDNNADKAILSNYMYLLWCLSVIWGMLDSDTHMNECIGDVMRYHQSVKGFDEVDFSDASEQLTRIGVVNILVNMQNEYSANKDIIQGHVMNSFQNETRDFMSNMGDSKIKSIAESVAKNIDLNEFKDIMGPLVEGGGDGGGMPDIMKLMGNPQVLNLAQKVAGTIQQQMDQGQLNETDIVNEAQNLMGFVQNSSAGTQMQEMLGGIMGQALGGGGGQEGQNINQMMNMFSGMMGGGDMKPEDADNVQQSISELEKLLDKKPE